MLRAIIYVFTHVIPQIHAIWASQTQDKLESKCLYIYIIIHTILNLWRWSLIPYFICSLQYSVVLVWEKLPLLVIASLASTATAPEIIHVRMFLSLLVKRIMRRVNSHEEIPERWRLLPNVFLNEWKVLTQN